ncbi:hypothetical protein GCM10010191_39120 [Actinomadura vinacea]|uniref:Peptidase C51 domain-containing protein n=1 Tax=Actinomadura vinacea TaxID=115336 RepID=A0ABP5WC50_9ACTN
MSFRSNHSHSALLATLRDRAGELTSQTLALRGRAATGVIGGVVLGALTFGSALGAVASAEAAPASGAAKARQAAPAAAPEKADKYAKSATTQQVIKLAEKQVGITEGQGGETKFHDWYIKSNAAKLTAARDGGSVSEYKGAQWCNMFVSWLGAKAGLKGMGADAYTVAHAEWFKKTGRWGQKAKPGAVVFFAWNGGGISGIEHVGMVVKDNGDGTITTIEGNTDNAVKEKVRDKSTVAGYGYPDYRS